MSARVPVQATNWADQADIYQLNEPGEAERTTFTLTRGGKPVSDR